MSVGRCINGKTRTGLDDLRFGSIAGNLEAWYQFPGKGGQAKLQTPLKRALQRGGVARRFESEIVAALTAGGVADASRCRGQRTISVAAELLEA